MQEHDDVLGGAIFYVQCHGRPTRRERTDEPRGVVKLLRHWSKLSIKDGMLYKTKKDKQMNMTIHQFAVPDSLKAQVLHGLHDSAGHTGTGLHTPSSQAEVLLGRNGARHHQLWEKLPLLCGWKDIQNADTDKQLDTLAQDHVVCTQPPPICTRAGQRVKHPARLICEMNEQIIDSMSTVDSLFSNVRNMFSE